MSSSLWTCQLCNKVMLRKSLYSHLRVVHLLTNEQVEVVKADVRRQAAQLSETERRDVVCPLCEECFVDQELLANHCKEEHEEDGAEGEAQDYTVFTLNFRSKQEFDVSSSNVFGNCTLTKLPCNRAGRYIRKTETQATHTKKDVSHCSCFLNVKIEDDGTVSVKGCLGHVGHKVDPALLRLTQEQQVFLKGMLEEFSHDYIIKRLRKDFSATTSRLYYVTKKDLWSLVERFGLRPGHRHKDDMQSLKARQEEGNPDDGIRLLELAEDPSGRGFRMIIIITSKQVEWLKKFSHRGISVDDTHNATRYNLKLATVTVLNERDTGVPAAFLLSGTMTSADVEKLFLAIQSVMPEFNPKQIVTDEAPCFYNGFRSGAKLHYCRWHIEKTWQRNANKLIKEPQIRNRLKMKLRDLLKIEDLPTFQQKFDRTPTWASFSNQGAIMDTTMISERWHLRLKTEFLHRNANARADCLVDLLIKAVEEMSKSDEIKARRRLAESSYRVQQTTICHRQAMKLFLPFPDRICLLSTDKWQVLTRQPEGPYMYITHVQRRGDCECSDVAEGNVHCPLCDVCPYAWSCSCTDNRAGISCMHRHAVMLHCQPPNRAAFRITAEAATEEGVPEDTPDQKVSVLQTNVNALVNTDTEEAKEMLLAIEDLVDEASKIYLTPLTGIAVRPEQAKHGGKPKQSKVQLYTRKQSRVAKSGPSHDGSGNDGEESRE
ncbi:zinc finger, C2H2 type [Ostertagia ostertagi]